MQRTRKLRTLAEARAAPRRPQRSACLDVGLILLPPRIRSASDPFAIGDNLQIALEYLEGHKDGV